MVFSKQECNKQWKYDAIWHEGQISMTLSDVLYHINCMTFYALSI